LNVQVQEVIEAVKAHEMDGEAMFTLAESASFDSEFSLFINTISQSNEGAQKTSFPFGHRIKLQAAIRDLATIPARINLDSKLSSSGCNTQQQVESPLNDGHPPSKQTQGDASCFGTHVPSQPKGGCPARSAPQQEPGAASSAAGFPVFYQTVDRDEPVLLVLDSSEATPAGLKRAIARAEGLDDYVPDGLGARPAAGAEAGASHPAAAAADSADYDRWVLRVRFKDGMEDLAVLTISNQRVRPPRTTKIEVFATATASLCPS
jgi:hypothetical protein